MRGCMASLGMEALAKNKKEITQERFQAAEDCPFQKASTGNEQLAQLAK